MENKETIVQKMYVLLKTSIPMLNKFPRNQRFNLGNRIQNHVSDLMENYIHAYYLPPHEKKPLLQKANIELEVIRHYYRLAYDLNLMSYKQYESFAKQLHEIGRMTGGWLKSIQ